MAERIDREELRALIREALKEALSHESPPPLRGRAREGGKPSARHPSPSPNPSPQGGGESARQASFSLTSGVLTETRVATLAHTHTKIVVGSGVAITPLARDKARELKIGIERQKP